MSVSQSVSQDLSSSLPGSWITHVGVLRTHLDDLRESLKQGVVWLPRTAGQGAARAEDTWQKGGRLVVPGGRKQPNQ